MMNWLSHWGWSLASGGVESMKTIGALGIGDRSTHRSPTGSFARRRLSGLAAGSQFQLMRLGAGQQGLGFYA